MRTIIAAVLILGTALSTAIAQTQSSDGAFWSQDAANHYIVLSDQPYVTVGGITLKLDVWQNHESTKVLPTVTTFTVAASSSATAWVPCRTCFRI